MGAWAPFLLGLLAIVGVRLFLQVRLYAAGFASLTADEFARVVMAGHWAEHPEWVTSGTWLPLHLYLYGSWLRLWWDLLWAPRLLTIGFGVLGIGAIACLTRSALGSWRWGLVAAALLAISPAHVWLSSTPLTEAAYTAFALAAIASLLRHLRSGRALPLVVSAVLLGLANGLRYEGWMLAMPYTVVLAWRGLRRGGAPQRRALLLGAAVLPWVVPLGWLVGHWLASGDALHFLRAIRQYKLTWYGGERSYLAYARTFWRLDPFATVLVPLGALIAWRRRDELTGTLAFLAVTSWAIFVVLHRGQVESTNNSVRYLAPFLFLAYPLALIAVDAVGRRLGRSAPFGRTLLYVVLALVATTRQVGHVFAFVPDGNAAGLAVGERLRTLRADVLADPERPVLIELVYWSYLAVQVGANDVDHVLYDRRVDLEHRQSRSIVFAAGPALRACLAEQHVAYVAARSPELQNVLRQRLESPAPERIGDWEIYAVPPPASDDAYVGHTPCPKEWERRQAGGDHGG